MITSLMYICRYMCFFNIVSFLFRETVTNLQADLIAATYVAKSGNPDFLTMADWINISCKYTVQRKNFLFKKKKKIVYFLIILNSFLPFLFCHSIFFMVLNVFHNI